MTVRAIDWHKVESDYRVGLLSTREISRQHGVSEAYIRKRAAAQKWERDLSKKVDERVRRELVRITVRAEQTAHRERSDKEQVEEAVATKIEILRGHRQAIGNSIRLVQTLSAQLGLAIEMRETLQEAIEGLTKDDANGQRFNTLMRAISIPAHVVAVRDLANAQKVLVGLERQSFGLADGDDAAPPPSDGATDHHDDEARFKRLEDRLAQVGREAANV